MSASGRLKAFMEDERWRSHDATVLAGLALMMKESALPQLLAVVEAAEDAADHFVDQSAHDHIWPIELNDALDALDEAL